jgi:putative cell wall-binding protein
MQRFRRVVSASLALGLIVALALPGPALALTFSASTIADTVGYRYASPDIGGRYVVFTRENESTGEADVWRYDRQTGALTRRTALDGKDQDGPRISGDRIVWIDHTEGDGEVYYDDMGDSVLPHRLTNDTNDDIGVDIDCNYIAWANGLAMSWQIRWYNIETGQYGTVTPNIPTLHPQGLRVDKGRILYWDEKEAGKYGVYLYDIESTSERTVTAVSASTYELGQIAIHGDQVVWTQWAKSTGNRNIWTRNVRSGLPASMVTADTPQEQYPTVFGDLMAWQTDLLGNQDIQGWWMQDMGFLDVVKSTAAEQYPDAFGHTVVYQKGPLAGSDIGLAKATLAPVRFAGANRYETCALISKNRFPKSGTAVIATGENFPDALAASALAGALECPLLLTRKDAVPGVVMAELSRLGVSNAFIIGSTATVASSVVTQLNAAGISSERIGGANRYATAAALVGWIVDIRNNDNKPNRKEAFFVRGDAFPDALSVAPMAYALGIPILLVRTDSVPTETRNAILNMNIQKGYVIGSEAAISAGTNAALDALLPGNTVRWGGANRYETAIICARNAVDRGWLDYDTIGVATGLNFPDALGGGAACGYYGSPVVLTPTTFVSASVDTFFTQRRYDFGGMEVYGDVNAVSAPVFTKLTAYLN